jgi:hypothetical protein
MIEFSFTSTDGVITMSDLVVTISAILSGIVAWRQKAKDQQLADRDKHIVWLQKRLDECREK